jgi:hypothetical protein
MQIGPVAAVAAPDLSAASLQRDPRAVAAAFDAMVLRLLAGPEGLFGAGAAAEDGEGGFPGEVLMSLVADQLAASLELGLGRMLLEGLDPSPQPSPLPRGEGGATREAL